MARTTRRPAGLYAGSVSAFDEARGLGTVTSEEGRRHPFHCTAVADGTRRIAVGTAVVFGLAPGHLGRLEAVGLRPVTPAAPDTATGAPGAGRFAPNDGGPPTAAVGPTPGGGELS